MVLNSPPQFQCLALPNETAPDIGWQIQVRQVTVTQGHEIKPGYACAIHATGGQNAKQNPGHTFQGKCHLNPRELIPEE
jgi:hypothetical protein